MSNKELTLHQKLMELQKRLKVRKGHKNDFGGYMYRSNEDILVVLKPLLNEFGLTLIQWDEMVECAGSAYIQNTAILSDGTDKITNSACAREEREKKKMDASQMSGTASSYARKYCLNGMFLLDDVKDADTNEYGKEGAKKASEHEKKWKKYINEQFAKCENEADVTQVLGSISNQSGSYHYMDYAKEKGAEKIAGFFNKGEK